MVVVRKLGYLHIQRSEFIAMFHNIVITFIRQGRVFLPDGATYIV